MWIIIFTCLTHKLHQRKSENSVLTKQSQASVCSHYQSSEIVTTHCSPGYIGSSKAELCSGPNGIILGTMVMTCNRAVLIDFLR